MADTERLILRQTRAQERAVKERLLLLKISLLAASITEHVRYRYDRENAKTVAEIPHEKVLELSGLIDEYEERYKNDAG